MVVIAFPIPHSGIDKPMNLLKAPRSIPSPGLDKAVMACSTKLKSKNFVISFQSVLQQTSSPWLTMVEFMRREGCMELACGMEEKRGG